ncbi:MAG: hypothetical protein GY827_11910 [Cytophagales bacterium]|nr:hypothetical protein [Cytophagales bacterium]
MRKIYLGLISIVLLLTACGDDEGFVIGRDMLLNNQESREWTLTTVRRDGQDITATYLEECETDNVLTLFKEKSKYSVNEGATKCGEEQIAEEGLWWISDDNTEFALLSTTYSTTREGNITSLTNNVFSFEALEDSIMTEWTYTAK